MYHILNDQMNIHSCRDIYVPYSEWSNDHIYVPYSEWSNHSCRDIYVPYSEWSNEHSLF